ncbi:hypothetical protein [Nostoc sp.]|uniref:hypothetical protein n=1 Tax=Nostoc sp. TaxID=1180 RepID=UPI002FF0E369
MSPYNEADTRAKLIDPQIKLFGWGESQIEREHYFDIRMMANAIAVCLTRNT